MIEGDRAWRASLRGVTIADLAADVAEVSGADALPRVAAWMAGGR
jgi:hypothetical protein